MPQTRHPIHPWRHRCGLLVLLVCLALCSRLALAVPGTPQPPDPQPLTPHLSHAPRSTVDDHRCGYEKLLARMKGPQVIGVAHVVRPDQPERDLDAAATPAAADTTASWKPIRIRVFTQDLDNSNKYCTAVGQTRPDFKNNTVSCTSEDILTSGKKKVLTELLIPQAIQLHEKRLNVQPVNGNIVVPSMSDMEICGAFTVPSSHMTTGVSDADFVLYMSAGPTEGNTIAWATTCLLFTGTGRPVVGVSNVSPKYISADPKTVRVITHELLHALGFNFNAFSSHKMASTALLRGKGSSPVITSAKVVEMAKAQYGCSTQTFMELEDEGGRGTAYSHWKRRSAKDELMAGISGVGHYTALTIAAMEDTGFYTGNYANAEPMSYGHNAGCALTTSKCVVNGVSQFPSMFCASLAQSLTCTTDHTAMGSCYIAAYKTSLPSYFQYFSNTMWGGTDSLMDYCPYVQEYSNTNCSTDGGALLGNVYGVNARCFNTKNGFRTSNSSYDGQLAICADIQCDSTTYGVKVLGASTYTTCTPGATLDLSSLSNSFSSGMLVCPSYDAVCIGQVDAAEYVDGASTTAAPVAGTDGVVSHLSDFTTGARITVFFTLLLIGFVA